jgi:hypothetical protein
MVNFKQISMKKAKKTGINFLAFFLAVLLMNGLVKKDEKGGVSALVTGAGVALHMAATEEWVESAALGAAFAGVTKLLHVSKTNGKFLGITLPSAVGNFIDKNVPQLAGGLNLSGMRGLGNMMEQRPLLPDNFNISRISGEGSGIGGYNLNEIS